MLLVTTIDVPVQLGWVQILIGPPDRTSEEAKLGVTFWQPGPETPCEPLGSLKLVPLSNVTLPLPRVTEELPVPEADPVAAGGGGGGGAVPVAAGRIVGRAVEDVAGARWGVVLGGGAGRVVRPGALVSAVRGGQRLPAGRGGGEPGAADALTVGLAGGGVF